MNRHLRCYQSPFGPYIRIPREFLNGARSVVLARHRGAELQPFAVRLPHQVYVRDLPGLLDGARELWALPVGVAGRWVQLAGPKPGLGTSSGRPLMPTLHACGRCGHRTLDRYDRGVPAQVTIVYDDHGNESAVGLNLCGECVNLLDQFRRNTPLFAAPF